jgi:glycerol-3-phosphate dehydrogenase (NAD(P)+)
MMAAMEHHQENTLHLPGVNLGRALTLTASLADACAGASLLVIVTPAQMVRSFCAQLEPFLTQHHSLLVASKGMEADTGNFMTDILEESFPQLSRGVISGPSFAMDVASNLPTAVSLASTEVEAAEVMASAFNSGTFRVYTNTDMVGTQVGGAFKNVLAIASGILVGKKLGLSAQAALITRGVYELMGLAQARGGHVSTLSGLSGVGDINLTCWNTESRNMAFGIAIGQGVPVETALTTSLVEGYETAKVIPQLAETYSLELPICRAVYDVLHGGASVAEVIHHLLERPCGEEFVQEEKTNGLLAH